MIHVSEHQLASIEYLLEQSAQGNHVWFEPEMIRAVFHESPRPMSESEAYQVEHHLERLFELKSFDLQRSYLAKLHTDELHRVIKTYFNIIENHLFENLGMKQ